MKQPTMETMADPFNCPTCGAHDYGLYLATAGGCIHCMKADLEQLRDAAKWLLAENYWLHRVDRFQDEDGDDCRPPAIRPIIDRLAAEIWPGELESVHSAEGDL